jgi:hypothetical protein
VEAIGWFTAQSPGCRQGTILAPMEAWQLLPCSGHFVPWETLDRRHDLRVAARSREQRRDQRRSSGDSPESGSSGGGGSCRTERSHSGRAGEPFVDERLQRGERKGPLQPAWRGDCRFQTSSDVTGRDGP